MKLCSGTFIMCIALQIFKLKLKFRGYRNCVYCTAGYVFIKRRRDFIKRKTASNLFIIQHLYGEFIFNGICLKERK